MDQVELRPIQTDPSKPNWNPYPEFDQDCKDVAKGFERNKKWSENLKKEKPVEYYKHKIRSKWAYLKWRYNI